MKTVPPSRQGTPDRDPIFEQPERVAEIAQRAFGDAKDAALAENKRLGIRSYGTVTDPRVRMRRPPKPR